MSISREDFAGTTQAKSDQMNAVDLVGGPLVCRITGIKMTGSPDQPVSISVDAHRQPWKPSKTFRRVLLLLWPGTEPDEWVGRDVVLWCDPDIKWAGEKVGGIAISHASHINERKMFSLAESKSKRKAIIVDPYHSQPDQAPQQPVFWPEDAFEKQYAKAEAKLVAGESQAEDVIAALEKKAPLTEGQKARLRRCKAADPVIEEEPPQLEEDGDPFRMDEE